MNLNKIRVAGWSLLLAIITSTNCFASSKAQEIKTLEFDKTIAIEDIEQYKSNIENEIMVDGIKYQLSDMQEKENRITITKDKEEKEQLIVKSSDKYSALKQFENEKTIEEIKECLLNGDFATALEKLKNIQMENNQKEEEKEQEEMVGIYPKRLSNPELEYIYMGLLLNDPKLIVKYYFLYEDCFFEDEAILNLYKGVLFTEGGNYTPEVAKKGFNFAKDTEQSYELKKQLKEKMADTDYNMEHIYTELRKLFILRKNYLEVPIKDVQNAIVDITSYELYNEMSEEEVESAIRQVSDTGKFKRAILNQDLSSFLQKGDNNLTNGLEMPFPILSSVFKGIRKGETMAFAMPSNSGKSRFTINLAAYTAFVHKKKVLIISNEMSEEKMRLV